MEEETDNRKKINEARLLVAREARGAAEKLKLCAEVLERFDADSDDDQQAEFDVNAAIKTYQKAWEYLHAVYEEAGEE